MIRLMSAVLATAALVACTEGQPLAGGAPAQASRFYADVFQDKPFDEAAVKVVVSEAGELRTYTLRPCNSGAGVCGATTGAYQVTPDYYVVSGAYPGRTFWLSPGGDGYMSRGGVNTNLAWNEATQ
ncbi:hypothetical protein FHS72_000188 [Loktanella ponticola]|uniref:Lipoprotein n=1 Tax=Yoonia ponticola TaxID=1524255 RepID=A0A7W9BI39_9RHOB|nr:hypothetical protein [Yoonia ponticola]MBB5720584.1 hypothetical protein [Yoonia ponticola]